MPGQSKRRLNVIINDLKKISDKLSDSDHIYSLRSHTDEKEISNALKLIDNAIIRLSYVEAL